MFTAGIEIGLSFLTKEVYRGQLNAKGQQHGYGRKVIFEDGLMNDAGDHDSGDVEVLDGMFKNGKEDGPIRKSFYFKT